MGAREYTARMPSAGKPSDLLGDERRQELACRNVTAGIIVDLAVLHQHIHGGCIRQRKEGREV